MKCYLFDIDGTLADLSHRLHYIQKPADYSETCDHGEFKPNWDEFFATCTDDKPIEHICDLAYALMCGNNHVVFVSGRSDAVRKETLYWLETNGLAWQDTQGRPGLYMRKAGDHRPDYVVKLELLAQIKADGWEPIMAFDDRNQVVAAFRDAGLPVAQVAPGDF